MVLLQIGRGLGLGPLELYPWYLLLRGSLLEARA
eukprot:Gb_02852 [translate_table: standard]